MHCRTCAPSEDSDQPAHSYSLPRIVTERILDCKGCNVSSCVQRRLSSDCRLIWVFVRRICFIMLKIITRYKIQDIYYEFSAHIRAYRDASKCTNKWIIKERSKWQTIITKKERQKQWTPHPPRLPPPKKKTTKSKKKKKIYSMIYMI